MLKNFPLSLCTHDGQHFEILYVLIIQRTQKMNVSKMVYYVLVAFGLVVFAYTMTDKGMKEHNENGRIIR